MSSPWRWTALTCVTALVILGPVVIAPAQDRTPDAGVAVYSPVEGPTAFVLIRPEGSRVKTGDLVCELDTGAILSDRLARQVRAADAALSDYQHARLVREAAQVAASEYAQLIYPQELQATKGEVALAEANRKRVDDRLGWSNTMREKGFLPEGQNLSDRLAHEQALLNIDTARVKQAVLEKYTREKKSKALQSEIENARADELAKEVVMKRELAQRRALEKLNAAGKLVAPVDGVVRYTRPVDATTRIARGELAFRIVPGDDQDQKGKNDKGSSGPLQKEKSFEKEVMIKVKLNYLLYLPEGYEASADKRWPLVLFLHGAGESGNDLEKVKVHGIPKVVEAKKDLPFIAVSPQSPGRGWNPDALNALLDEIEANYRVDKDRVYLTGLSMGGYGTWALAAAHPERFAAIAPICGGGNTRTASRLKDLPIWVFHGAKDRTVPLSQSEDMVKALKDAGAKEVKFTVYPEAGHDSWTETYDNPEFYTWLLGHTRRQANP